LKRKNLFRQGEILFRAEILSTRATEEILTASRTLMMIENQEHLPGEILALKIKKEIVFKNDTMYAAAF
jgi:hypothetical protein